MGGFGSGRPSRPKEVKDLVGEKPSRQNNNVPQLAKITRMDPPAHLSDDAVEVWDYYAPGLIQAGVLAYADVDMLSEFCVAVSTARKAQEMLELEGHVLEKSTQTGVVAYRNPWASIHKDAVNDMQRIAARFGLTPADRARIITPGDDKPQDNPADLLT